MRYKTTSAIYISCLHISVVILSLWIFIHISCWQIQNKPNYTHITSTCWVTKSTIIDNWCCHNIPKADLPGKSGNVWKCHMVFGELPSQPAKHSNQTPTMDITMYEARWGGATSGVTIWRSPSWRRWQTTIYGTGSQGYHTSWKNSILNKVGMDVSI